MRIRNKTIVLLISLIVFSLGNLSACRSGSDQPVPHLVFLISDDESNYQAQRTIPIFAKRLPKRFSLRCTILQATGKLERSQFPGLESLDTADLLIIFFRRRAIPLQQIEIIRSHLRAGKPIIGLRTANHAFSVHGDVPNGFEAWPNFAPEVLGCDNHGYGPAEMGTEIHQMPGAAAHPILNGIDHNSWHSEGSLYYVKPIDSAAVSVPFLL